MMELPGASGGEINQAAMPAASESGDSVVVWERLDV